MVNREYCHMLETMVQKQNEDAGEFLSGVDLRLKDLERKMAKTFVEKAYEPMQAEK